MKKIAGAAVAITLGAYAFVELRVLHYIMVGDGLNDIDLGDE
ncbi:MAG: hypothetical protein ACXWOV_02795 [Isosphaeraceae bacterium]